MTTPGDLAALPLWADFDDQTVLINRLCNLDMFEDHFLKALSQLPRDGESTARLFHYCVRPWCDRRRGPEEEAAIRRPVREIP